MAPPVLSMEDVSQSLQEAHERCYQLSEDVAETREQTQAKLDTKVGMAPLDPLTLAWV